MNEPHPRPTVLVVEDDPDNQSLMVALLSAEYEVLLAATGADARAHLANRENDLSIVLMDLALRGAEDGTSLTRHIRERFRERHLPVIVTTAFALNRDRRAALDAGCDAFLAKPIEPDELLGVMTSLLGRCPGRRS